MTNEEAAELIEPVPEEVRGWCRMYDAVKEGVECTHFGREDDALRAHFAAVYQGREVQP